MRDLRIWDNPRQSIVRSGLRVRRSESYVVQDQTAVSFDDNQNDAPQQAIAPLDGPIQSLLARGRAAR
jgi:hypothetical protein